MKKEKMKHYEGTNCTYFHVKKKVKLKSRPMDFYWHKTIRTYFQNYLWIIAYKIYVQ